MAEIRENQIRQVRDEDNRLKRIVIERYKTGVKSYTENIKPVEIIDKSIVFNNKDDVANFKDYLNSIYIRFKIFDDSPEEMYKTLVNKKEYLKFKELINIVKPLKMYEKIISMYINPATNHNTRELIMANLISLKPFLKKVIYDLHNFICIFCKILEGQMFRNIVHEDYKRYRDETDGITREKVFIADQTIDENVLEFIYKDKPEYKKYIKKLLVSSNVPMDKITMYMQAFIHEFEPSPEIVHFTELCALLQLIYDNIEKNKISMIDSNGITFQIIQILNAISTKFDNVKLKEVLLKLFNKGNLPELSPYFGDDYEKIDEKLNKLKTMNTAMEEAFITPLKETGEEKAGDDTVVQDAIGQQPKMPFVGQSFDDIMRQIQREKTDGLDDISGILQREDVLKAVQPPPQEKRPVGRPRLIREVAKEAEALRQQTQPQPADVAGELTPEQARHKELMRQRDAEKIANEFAEKLKRDKAKAEEEKAKAKAEAEAEAEKKKSKRKSKKGSGKNTVYKRQYYKRTKPLFNYEDDKNNLFDDNL